MANTHPDHLPFLPGNSFKDPTKQRFHVTHTLNYQNGYMQPKVPRVGFGGEQLYYNQISEDELNELANKMPTLTYGQVRQAPPERFIPAHVAFDKKVLKFDGYFKETVTESAQEHYRVRPVEIYYYLEDDSIAIIEPRVENSGIPQGKFLKRQQLPKDDQGNNWHWKDLNISKDFVVYGRVFRITNCDKFTLDYLTSQGIVVDNAESIPKDPYTVSRIIPPQQFITKTNWDARKRFLELDRKVLRFYMVWDDRDTMFGELRPFIMFYFLHDDTMEVREVRINNDGHDPFPVLIRRQKLPKNRNDVKSTFAAIFLELSSHEIKDYFTAIDFQIGKTVLLYNRRFLIYDCDDFTKNYYRQCYGVTNFTPVDVKGPAAELPKRELPPWNGYGSLEDSEQYCKRLAPIPPQKDFIKALHYDKQALRYELRMISLKPENNRRKFIMTYRLADDMLSVYERIIRNSGVLGGKYLLPCRVVKPGCGTSDHPVYYSPADFAIGSVITLFKHRFEIVNCDEAVLTILEQNPDWPQDVVESIRKLHKKQAPLDPPTEHEKEAQKDIKAEEEAAKQEANKYKKNDLHDKKEEQ